MGHTKRQFHLQKLGKHMRFIFQTSKPHFSPQIGRENWSFEGLLWGRKPKYILGLGLVRGGIVVREKINSEEGVRSRIS